MTATQPPPITHRTPRRAWGFRLRRRDRGNRPAPAAFTYVPLPKRPTLPPTVPPPGASLTAQLAYLDVLAAHITDTMDDDGNIVITLALADAYKSGVARCEREADLQRALRL